MTSNQTLVRIDRSCLSNVHKIAGTLQSKLGQKVTNGEAISLACDWFLLSHDDKDLQPALQKHLSKLKELLDQMHVPEGAPPQKPTPSKKKARR